ncbi:shikimate dehydrogenase [Aestuariibacter sp. A3R04]|uniref:shikimate dehydrogenase n=1 Tax=Aestuariibacter sp. A3R04 TaxID=2841571 RepID=UPI001C0A4AA4|nr:shikimate dehydrogenase [Aestuariibacter sp. A3R04]MBU3020182.1 shikimate dehydrogenase [Aestuariibacter sp. A3R04]
MKKFAVFGNPIAHSLSPAIHKMFAENTGEEIDYGIVESDIDAFESDIETFFTQDNVVGCNVTAPFKGRAYELSKNNCNAEAKTAEAVNTLFMKDGTLLGYTTDGMGLVADLHSQVGSLVGHTVLLLGAGGATRGVVEPLLGAKVKGLYINNRTEIKAQAIVDAIKSPVFECVSKNDLTSLQPDIVINCTSASLTGDLPQVSTSVFKRCSLAYDMVYGKGETRFMEFAKTHGAKKVSDGFGMLVEQAAAAFTIWTGKKPDTAKVIEALRPR